MQLGLVGVGRMGGNMRDRLRAAGHEVLTYDRDPARSDTADLADLVARLKVPRVVWMMLPAAVTSPTIEELADHLSAGDLVVDGGNSPFTEDGPRARRLAERGVGYLDVGVSGGIWGREQGNALMVGGAASDVARCQPIFDALRPKEGGFVHAGGVGAGHYAKMIHNGVEYALMQAYGEGYELLSRSELIEDVPGVLQAWRSGSVVRSWLLDLLCQALAEDPRLAAVPGYAEDTGEGRWTVDEAVRMGVPAHVITAALFARFASRQADAPALKAVAALRQRFGGHRVEAG